MSFEIFNNSGMPAGTIGEIQINRLNFGNNVMPSWYETNNVNEKNSFNCVLTGSSISANSSNLYNNAVNSSITGMGTYLLASDGLQQRMIIHGRSDNTVIAGDSLMARIAMTYTTLDPP